MFPDDDKAMDRVEVADAVMRSQEKESEVMCAFAEHDRAFSE